MIDLWAHDIGERAGGIQSYTAAIVEAMKGLYGPEAIHLSLKHERTATHPVLRDVNCHCSGHIPASARTGVFALRTAAWALAHQPELIFSSHPNFARLGILTKSLVRAPFWTAAHGIDVWEDCPPAVVAALKSADRIVAVSHFTKRKMVECHGVPEELISVLPNTFDAQRFRLPEDGSSLRDSFGLPQADKLLLSVGRLAEPARMKGFDKVIEALPEILRKVPQARYVIAGSGPDRARLEQIAAECGVSDRVTFMGFVPDARLADLYQACDVFVLPSKKEGFGIVFLEALACGLPVIAGNVDASGEPLLGGELGVLVDPNATNQIAAKSINLLARDQERPQLWDAAYLSRRVTEAFGPIAFQNHLHHLLTTFAPAFGRSAKASVCRP
ncbi:MAG TPA: glycosyltransferase family 4 protein [Chthoniobacterales bacterium]|jgi:glycosyltransferase involved in cell wall biosynthesis